jgi:hypothetical protein
MAYNNYGGGYGNRGGYGSNYGSNYGNGGGYSRGRSYGNGGGGYSRSQSSGKKHSGCKSKAVGDGVTVVSGWNYSRSRGMITAYARPYKGTKFVDSGRGKQWANYFVTITNTRTMQVTKTSGMFDVDTNRVYIKDLNMVMSPGKNYFGTHIRKTR